jgi:hypothetical protein
MAAYFWVGGSGTWDSATTTHWASLSGGVGNAGVPTAADTATFDANSGAAATVTVAATAVSLSTTVNKADITLTLSGSPTLCTTAGTLTFTAGTINLAGFTLSTGIFSSSNANTRAIAFSTGNIALTSNVASTIILSMAIATGFTWTGTGSFVRNQVTTATVAFGTTGGTTTNAPNLTVNAGASYLTFTSGSYFKNVDCTGSTCTVSGPYNACGNLIFATGGTYTSTNPTFLASGTFTSNTKTTSIVVISAVGGTVTLGSDLTTASVTVLTDGTFNLANFNLSALRFNGTGTATRAIAFGTGNITLTSTAAAALVLSMGDATNFTWTGTGGFLRNQAATATVAFGTIGGTTTNAVDLTLTGGGSELTVSIGSYFRNVDFSGSSCRVTNGFNVCGNLSLHPSGIYNFSPTFLASGTLTTSSNSLGGLIVSGTGITVTLADALTTSGAVTLTNGTLKFKSAVTSTIGSFVTTGTTLKYLTSTTSGTRATLSDTTGTNTVTYLSIKDIAATGGAVWDATSATNVDAGNNTGWSFPLVVPVTGVSATGVIGDVTIYLLLVVSATGVQVIGVIGNVVVTSGNVFVYPIGVVAYGLIGPVNVWGLVIDGQVPNWTIIADGLPSAWSAVSNPQTPSWQPVVN